MVKAQWQWKGHPPQQTNKQTLLLLLIFLPWELGISHSQSQWKGPHPPTPSNNNVAAFPDFCHSSWAIFTWTGHMQFFKHWWVLVLTCILITHQNCSPCQTDLLSQKSWQIPWGQSGHYCRSVIQLLVGCECLVSVKTSCQPHRILSGALLSEYCRGCCSDDHLFWSSFAFCTLCAEALYLGTSYFRRVGPDMQHCLVVWKWWLNCYLSLQCCR